MEEELIVLLGGRVAEKVVLEDISTGASNDIEQATKLARAMITRYGMSEDFDMVAMETLTNQYLGGDTALACSAETQAEIDKKLRTTGIILDDPVIQEAMRPVKISRKSETNDTLSAVSSEELQNVMDTALKTVTEQVQRIQSGESGPAPLQDGQEAPCSYCGHADACLFDSTLPGCRIREIKHTRTDQAAV